MNSFDRLNDVISQYGFDEVYNFMFDSTEAVFDAFNEVAHERSTLPAEREKFPGGAAAFDAEMEKMLPRIVNGIEGGLKRQLAAQAEIDNWRETAKKNKQKPEAPESAPFGAFAFPGSRSVGFKPLPPEPDTPVEYTTGLRLLSHIEENGDLGTADVEAIKLSLRHSWYPKIITPPGSRDTLYRGISVPVTWLTKNVPGFDPTQETGSVSGRIKYHNSSRNASPWTHRLEIARKFADESLEGAGVVFELTAGKNPHLLWDLINVYRQMDSVAGRYKSEMEVLGLGNLMCDKITWHLARMPVTEASKSKKVPEAPEKAALGKWAFPDRRLNMPYEEDTLSEVELFEALYNHFERNDPLNAEHCNLIKKFMKSGQYSPVFSEPPTSKTLYRGWSSIERRWRRS